MDRPMRTVFLLLLLVAIAPEPMRAAAPFTAAALAPDGKQAVLGSQSGIEIRSWPELVVTSLLLTELTNVHDLKFSPDGKTLLAAGGSPAEDGAVEVLSWPSGQRVRRVTGHDDVVYRVAWSPNGQQWATAGADGICQTFTSSTGERLARYEGHSRAVLSIAYLDTEKIASVGVDQTLRLWESGTGNHLRTLDNHVGTVNDIAVRQNTSHQAPMIVATISEDRTVRLWQPLLGRLMRFARLPSPPRAVAWSADGGRLYVACTDGLVRILDPDTVDVVSQLQGLDGRIHELAIDSARNRILVCGEAGCRSMESIP